MTTCSSILAWKIPWAEEPGKLQSSSVQFSWSIMSDSFWSHGLQHTRLPYPSPIPGTYSNSCLLSRWCHPTILSSVVLFSSCLQSFQHQSLFHWVMSRSPWSSKESDMAEWFSVIFSPLEFVCILLLEETLSRYKHCSAVAKSPKS